jgi:hypothetical protein
VALEVRSHTGSNDSVFVWGFEPAVYWLSERQPSSRFIYNVPQRSPWQAKYARRELMRDLTRDTPATIVVQTRDVFPSVTGNALDSRDSLPSFPELDEFISSKYVFRKRLEDFDIYALARQ